MSSRNFPATPRTQSSSAFSQSSYMSPPRSPVSSRSSSILRTPTAAFSFVCRHEPNSSRLSASLMRFQLSPQALGTRKCYDCQTSTATGTRTLLTAMTLAPGIDKLDPKLVKQAAQLLFERVAGQRRKVDMGFKDQWKDIELAFATFCYNHITAEHISDLCQTVRTKYGAGIDRQLLRALAEAACRTNKVWEYFVTTTDFTVYITLNDYIEKLRQATELTERFSQVQDMFRNAEALGLLAMQTISVLGDVDFRLSQLSQ
ncbi:hypothetical protein GGR55DRAFT_495882 [Xylaria sp. FL0064]|nr:hypothetical protein GGR55DRAFT_495882 [Xylaria sp. FL0064]